MNKKGKGTDIPEKQQGGVSIKRFALTYVVLMGIFFFVIGFVPLQRVFDVNGVYTGMITKITAKILGVAGIPAVCQGSVIALPSISLDVKFGCNGLEAVMIYAVAVIAFPASWKKKALAILAGLVIIQVINVLRIAGLAYAGIHYRQLFEYMHIYVAQGMMIAVSFFTFLGYLHYATPAERKDH
ncbi:MAG: exosortase H [Nitrospiraceae bacterium]|nr:exosortase H [Nitrospiraceae bacterium]